MAFLVIGEGVVHHKATRLTQAADELAWHRAHSCPQNDLPIILACLGTGTEQKVIESRTLIRCRCFQSSMFYILVLRWFPTIVFELTNLFEFATSTRRCTKSTLADILVSVSSCVYPGGEWNARSLFWISRLSGSRYSSKNIFMHISLTKESNCKVNSILTMPKRYTTSAGCMFTTPSLHTFRLP